MFDRYDPAAIERYAQRLVDRSVGELIDVVAGEEQGTYTKGSVGRYVESYFGIAANSDAAPDFGEAGVELKTVPMRAGKRGALRAKERTFITAIDYRSIYGQAFEGSPLDMKTRKSLFVFYGWQKGVPISQFRVLGVLLHERDELDELILRDAHEHVRRVVRAGEAHLLSEGDTWGVGAATKDAGGLWVDQPFGHEPARRRAFAYKADYSTKLWKQAQQRRAEREAAAAAIAALPDSMASFVEEVGQRVGLWVGESVRELTEQLAPSVNPNAKNIASVVSRRLLGSGGRRDVEAFERLGITVRTIRVDTSGRMPYEDISFSAFVPDELVAEEWEASSLLEQVSSLYFMVFTADPSDAVIDARLLGGFFWRPNTEELAIMAREWEQLREAFARSAPEDRPQASETQVLHVRPHGRDARDTVSLPSGRPFVRSSFWLNRRFVGRLVRQRLG